MEHEASACYILPCNRLFNLLAIRTFSIWDILVAILCVALILWAPVDAPLWLRILSVCVSAALLGTIRLLGKPKCLEVTSETVSFAYRGALLHLFRYGWIYTGADDKSRYTESYKLYNIRRVDYLQTPIEKWFDCGHIRICGDVNLGAEQTTRTFVIYGIRDFKDMSDWMANHIKLQGDTQAET